MDGDDEGYNDESTTTSKRDTTGNSLTTDNGICCEQSGRAIKF